jgi:hypothetical protein
MQTLGTEIFLPSLRTHLSQLSGADGTSYCFETSWQNLACLRMNQRKMFDMSQSGDGRELDMIHRPDCPDARNRTFLKYEARASGLLMDARKYRKPRNIARVSLSIVS